MWIMYTAIGLVIALAVVGVYLLTCIRVLQALASVASDQNSTIIFPLPIELLRPFLMPERNGKAAEPLANGRHEDVSPGLKEPSAAFAVPGAAIE